MTLELPVNTTCSECGVRCDVYLKEQSRTVRVECPVSGIEDYIPEYDERVSM